MATPSAGIGKQRIRGAVGSDDTQRASKKQREPEVWQDVHMLTVPKRRRAPIPARNGSGRSRSTLECQQRQDASIPLLEKRARHRGRALSSLPGSGRPAYLPLVKRSGEHGSKPRSQIRLLYFTGDPTRGHLEEMIRKRYQVTGRGSREKGEALLAAQRTPHRVPHEERGAVTPARARGRPSRAGAWAG